MKTFRTRGNLILRVKMRTKIQTVKIRPIFEQSKKIVAQLKSYDTPESLLFAMYGNKIITEMVKGTNERA